MKLTPPLTKLNIAIQDSGFYSGFNQAVVVSSKVLLASPQMKYDRLWQQKLCLDRPDLVGSAGMKCQQSRHAKTIVT